MSASPMARQACSQVQTIPTKSVLIHHESELPDIYSSTPGGTLYSTTPGGTRIVYERAFLMNLKNSPLAKTPPSNLSLLPHNIVKGNDTTSTSNTANGKHHGGGQRHNHGYNNHGHSPNGHFHHGGHQQHHGPHIGASPLTKPMTNMSLSSQRKTSPPKFDDHNEQFDMDL